MKKSAIAALLAQTESELGAADAELDTFAKAEQSKLGGDYEDLDEATEASGDGEDADGDETGEGGEDGEPESDEDGETLAKADQGDDEGYIDAGPILQELLGEIKDLRAEVGIVRQGNAVLAKALQGQGRGIGSFAKALQGVSEQPVRPSTLRVPTQQPQQVVIEADAGEIMAKATQAISTGDVSSVDLAKFNALSQEYGVKAALANMPDFKKFIS